MKQIRHKFNAIPVILDNIHFASKKEAAYYQQLVIRQRAGNVIFFLRQVALHLPGKVKYIVDFVVFEADQTVHFVDVKGMRTPLYIAKKKIAEGIYPITIEEV